MLSMWITLLSTTAWQVLGVGHESCADYAVSCRLSRVQLCIDALQTATPKQVAAGTALGVALQGALAAPFLAAAPASYASKAFELSRVFLYRWTVNLRFLPEAMFQR